MTTKYKDGRVGGHRLALGPGFKTAEFRTAVPELVVGIWEPDHSLHRLADPRRYDERDEELVRLALDLLGEVLPCNQEDGEALRHIPWLAVAGPLCRPSQRKPRPVHSPALCRPMGTWGDAEETHLNPSRQEFLRRWVAREEYLLRHHGVGIDQFRRTPRLETIFGNRRLRATQMANQVLTALGKPPLPFPFLLREGLSQAEAERIYRTENGRRKGISLLEEWTQVREMRACLRPWEDIAEELGRPLTILRPLHEKLAGAVPAVILALEGGALSRRQANQIAARPPAEQPALVENPGGIAFKPPKKDKLAAADRRKLRILLAALAEEDYPTIKKAKADWLRRVAGLI
jgi:ParB-like chromosome segregation protein Spo0J